MQEVDLLIESDLVVTMDPERRVYTDGAVAVKGDTIAEVGARAHVQGLVKARRTITSPDMVVLPGLISVHSHTFQSLYRGLGDDMTLFGWFDNVIHPLSEHLDPEAAYVGSLLSCLEMIKSGTTCFGDVFYAHTNKSSFDESARGVYESGIRAVLARATRNVDPVPPYLKETIEEAVDGCVSMIEKWPGKSGGRVTVCPSPCEVWSCSDEMILAMAELAEKYQLPLHSHVASNAETLNYVRQRAGRREVEHLKALGVLKPEFVSIHSVLLADSEIQILRDFDVKVAHCPTANQYLGYGTAPIVAMLREGITVGLGCDGAASNNNLDMLEGLKFCALLHKNTMMDPTALTAERVLEIATIEGARVLGLEKEVGSLEKGKKADLVLVDVKKPHFTPRFRTVSNLIYSANGADVDSVIVGGQVVMENRQVKTLDEEEVMERANRIARILVEKAGREDLLKLKRWKMV
ncbi:MAG: amidohydrolase family protein [Nitrospinota bacterium]